MKYLHIRLEELLSEHGLSKKKVCSALDIERTNFNITAMNSSASTPI